MKQSFFVYPGGLSGAALLFLRVSVALSLSAMALGPLASHVWPDVALSLLALILSFGFCTRISACAAAATFVAQLIVGPSLPLMPLVADALTAASLAMAGPGAFSLDALRFGRRTLHLPD